MHTKGSGPLLLLALLTVAGCGSSAARAVSAPAPPPRTAARLDAGLAPVVGRFLAVTDLLGDADTLLTSGYAAQDEQLPDSARADFSDAGTKLSAAEFAANNAGRPSQLHTAAALIARSLSAYRQADDEAMGRPDASKTASASGHQYADRAVAILDSRAEASLPAADTARRQLLALAIRTTAPHRVPPAPMHRQRHGRPRTRLVVVVSTPTPTKPALPQKPLSVRVTRIALPVPSQLRIQPGPKPATRRHAVSKRTVPGHKHAVPIVHHARPSLPSPSARKEAILASRAKEASRLLAGASSALAEGDAIARCSAALTSLASGTDPTGAAHILACVDHALKPLHHLLAETTRRLRAHLPVAIRGEMKKALRAARRAEHNLHLARRAVQAAEIDLAQQDLAAAGRAMLRATTRLRDAATALTGR